MDSIIASQQIGKRKRSSELKARNAPLAEGLTLALIQGGAQPRTGRASERLGRREFRREQPRRSWPRFPLPGSGGKGSGGGFGRLLAERGAALKAKLGGLSRKSRAALVAASALLALGLAFGIAALARGPSFPMPKGALLPAEDSAQDFLLDYSSPELAGASGDSELDAAKLPPPPVTMQMGSYTVRNGDSVASIAKRFGLNVDTVISANGLSDSSSVRPGRTLRIPNINGLAYKVRSGDSIASVAKKYKIDATKLVDANDLASETLMIGQTLFIPGARLPQTTIAQVLGQNVAWPVRGPLSSYFGYRPDPFTGVRRFHNGIDIVVNMGTPVRAAMAGRVEDVGYNASYGNYVIMNHAGGFQTLYGHLTSASVSIGQNVAQGATIGLSGNTGYSTGPHVHFSLFKRSLALNPLKYLK
jgi:Membrane proteins related to metalloendopeptidases